MTYDSASIGKLFGAAFVWKHSMAEQRIYCFKTKHIDSKSIYIVFHCIDKTLQSILYQNLRFFLNNPRKA